ncbi:MAG: EamA family transporter [Candidatus Limnocylindrales bacterium]
MSVGAAAVTGAAEGSRPASGGALEWAALLTVYIVWGSTYLGIRVVVMALPPLTSAGIRFAIAGGVMLLAVLASGRLRRRPGPRELLAAAAVGCLLLVSGNGFVSIGEQHVPSAMAALIIASVPLWVIVLRRLAGQPVHRGTMVGVAVGFLGVGAMLVPIGLGGTVDPASLAILVVAAFSWASGSFLATRLAMPRDPFVSTAAQMLTAAAALLVLGLGSGERIDGAAVAAHPSSLLALAYLTVFGSLLAFTAYAWLLQHAPISRVATYAYVNPLVAVILGALILGESITPPILVGGAIIVLAVALVIGQESRGAAAPELPG